MAREVACVPLRRWLRSTSFISLHAPWTLGLLFSDDTVIRERATGTNCMRRTNGCSEEPLRFRGSACYSNTQKSLLRFRVKVWTNKPDHTLLRDIESYANAPLRSLPTVLSSNNCGKLSSLIRNLSSGLGREQTILFTKFPFATKCLYFQTDKIFQLYTWLRMKRYTSDVGLVYKTQCCLLMCASNSLLCL